MTVGTLLFFLCNFITSAGIAQMEEGLLTMQEVTGSKPSKDFAFYLPCVNKIVFRIQCLHYKPVSNHFCSRGRAWGGGL
jgi:hypothetical protein